MLCGIEGGRLPGKDVFYDFLRDTPQSELDSAMVDNTQKMFILGLVVYKNLIVDSMSIFANIKLNNPKSFSKSRFKKSQIPAGDSNCMLVVYTASNDSRKEYEYFWGYKEHLILDVKFGLPIFYLTLTANTHDDKSGEKLALQAASLLPVKSKVKWS